MKILQFITRIIQNTSTCMCKTVCDAKCKLYHIFSRTSIAAVEPVCKENIISCRRNQYESKEGTHHTEKEVNQYTLSF